MNLIRKESELAKVKGSIKVGKYGRDLEVNIGKNYKKVFLNKTEIRKISDYITNLNVILFTPDDLDIIKGSPQIRRNLLNVEISQISSSYIQALNEYNKILKTRNEYLKTMYINHLSDTRYLDILTDKLTVRAAYIYQYRYQFLKKINDSISTIYEKITGVSDLHVIYENSIELKGDFSLEEIEERLRKKFQKHVDREIQQGNTLYGPHRDDFSFYIGEDNVKLFSSQGGQRMAVIALKLAEIPIFKEMTGENPILLLDDIFSEIDSKRKRKLVSYIRDDVQTIITATDLKNINNERN